MRKIVSLFLIFFCLIIYPRVSSGEVPRKLPFPHIIDWSDTKSRKNYKEALSNAGIVTDVAASTATELAAEKRCFLLKDNGIILGYGALFIELRVWGQAENKKTGHGIKIDIRKVEIIFDNGGRYAFLTTHRFRLSLRERLFAWGQRKKHDVEHGLYSGPDLGYGYFLDKPTQELASSLLTEAKTCGPSN